MSVSLRVSLFTTFLYIVSAFSAPISVGNIPMTLQTSVLGSLPRSVQVLNQFRDYDNVYRNPTALAVLEEGAREIILKQESLLLDIVNDGEIQRSGYFSVFYDCFDGYMPTGINVPTLLDDGRYWDHHVGQAYQVWERPSAHGLNPAWLKYGAVIVDKLARKNGDLTNSVFERETRVMKKHASKPVKLTLPSPYEIMRTSWHPVFSRDAYPTQEAYLDDIVKHYKPIIQDCERLGVEVIQFDDDRITMLLDPRLRQLLNLEREIECYTSSLNQLFPHVRSAASAVHICRAIDHKSIPWREAGFLQRIIERLRCDQFSLAINDTAEDLEAFRHFPPEARLLFGIIDSSDYTLETLDAMFRRLKSVTEYVSLEHIILTSSCGFSPYSLSCASRTLGKCPSVAVVRAGRISLNSASLSPPPVPRSNKA